MLQPVTTTRQGRHVQTLSRIERAAIAAVIGPVLPTLGYPAPSRRAVAAGMIVRLGVVPTRVRERLELHRLRRRLRTPADRYREVHRVMREDWAKVGRYHREQDSAG